MGAAKVTVDLTYTIAKVRAMRSDLYEGPQLAALERASNIPELAQLLGFEEAALSALELESLLTARHVADLLRVGRLLDGARGRLFDWLLARYQMENLKVVLRFWAAGEPLERLSRMLVEVEGLEPLPVEALAEARDLGGFIRLVPEPVFAEGLSQGVSYWEAEGRTFLAEAGLDAAYFRELIRRHHELGRADRTATDLLIRSDLDGYNLLVVCRAQLNYHLQLEDVARFVVAGGRIPRSALLQARGDSLTDILTGLRVMEVLHLGESLPGSLPELEDAMTLRLYRVANRCYYQSMLDLGGPVAFYYLKRNELANLIKVAEGLRYEVSWAEVARRLVPPLAGEEV